MKFTEENNKFIKEIIDASLYWAEAIKSYVRDHKVSQEEIANHLHCAQSTISKKLNLVNAKKLDGPYWHLSLSDAKRICEAMGTTLGAVLYEYDVQNAQDSQLYANDSSQECSPQELFESIPKQCHNIPDSIYSVYPSCLFPDNANLVNNKNNPLFLPWFGKYHCYFYSTLSNEDICFHGILDIPKTPMEGCCNVDFYFTYDEKARQYKRYYGQLVLSKKQSGGAYCTLVNHNDQGEITYLVMANPAIKNSHVCCVLAFVSTISAGKGTNHPCVERMIISREPLDGSELEMAKVHLLLNDKRIRITEDSFRTMLQTEDLPESFKKRFPDCERLFDIPPLSDYLARIAVIPEHWVKSLPGYTEQEQQMIIDYIRRYSLAPKYNKIKEKTAENDIYEMFRDKFEKWNSLSIENDKTTG